MPHCPHPLLLSLNNTAPFPFVSLIANQPPGLSLTQKTTNPLRLSLAQQAPPPQRSSLSHSIAPLQHSPSPSSISHRTHPLLLSAQIEEISPSSAPSSSSWSFAATVFADLENPIKRRPTHQIFVLVFWFLFLDLSDLLWMGCKFSI